MNLSFIHGDRFAPNRRSLGSSRHRGYRGHRGHRAARAAAVVATLALGAVIAVPAVAAEKTPPPAKTGVVNVNTAEIGQLALLPRIGPAVAKRIIEHREVNGPFAQPAELLLVKGIGDRTFALLEPYVVVEGDTTLAEKVRAGRVGLR